MREIKFRYWDPFNEVMIYSEKMYLSIFFSTFVMTKEGKNNPVLMEFTGLKDKAGKKIYESDIIDFGSINHLVYFEAGMFLIKSEYQSDEGYESLCWYSDDHEVVGNIYENPELLKEEAIVFAHIDPLKNDRTGENQSDR